MNQTGMLQTFHDFNWSAKSKIRWKDITDKCHCRWELGNNSKISNLTRLH